MRNDLWVRMNTGIEHLIVTRLVPRRVGKVMRLFFKIPVLLYRLGLGGVVPKRILILTTTGRKTGKRRQTALEYGYNPQQGAYFLMTGWGGKSDWYRNALAHPYVEIRIRNSIVQGFVRPAADEEVLKVMLEVLAVNPGVVKTWAIYSGVHYDGTRESLARMAIVFPSIYIKTGDIYLNEGFGS